MTLRIRLIWAFSFVAFVALVLSFLGLNVGMYATMMREHMGGMSHGQMMADGQQFWGLAVRWSLWSSIAALSVAAVVGYFTAGRITRSLRYLREAAGRLDLRDLSRRVPVEGDDEIGDLARTFNRMCDRLEADERSRRQLLADVAHELRHPLAALQGRLDLILDGKVESGIEALVPLQDEVIRLSRLVGDLRELSLAEVGQLSLNKTLVDVSALLAPLLANLEPVAGAKGILLESEVAPGVPEIRADADRLRQILVNLLANALQYTPSGGRVIVRVWEHEGRLNMKVSDTGPGIAPEDLPHIFDRFYRADKSRARSTGGSGLGLAIVRSLVALHNGSVEVESTPGFGTSFLVSLPVSG